MQAKESGGDLAESPSFVKSTGNDDEVLLADPFYPRSLAPFPSILMVTSHLFGCSLPPILFVDELPPPLLECAILFHAP